MAITAQQILNNNYTPTLAQKMNAHVVKGEHAGGVSSIKHKDTKGQSNNRQEDAGFDYVKNPHFEKITKTDRALPLPKEVRYNIVTGGLQNWTKHKNGHN